MIKNLGVKIEVRVDNNLLQAYLLLKNMSNNSYLVGGCVRDMLMDVQCKDYDLVTDTPMDQIEAEFTQNGWKVDSVGLQFLVLFASKNGFNVEIVQDRFLSKVVYRVNYSDTHDLIVVVIPERWFVKTVWLNAKSDKHQTLNKNRYETKSA